MKNYLSIPANDLRLPTMLQLAKLTCEFRRYYERKLWYSVHWTSAPDVWPDHLDPLEWDVVESRVFEFPVPVDDLAATGEFNPEMKAITLMRWIQAHIKFLKDAREAT